MKRVDVSEKFLLMDFIQAISHVWGRWRKQQIPLAIAIGLCLNLIIAPVVYAADSTLDRQSTLALGILGVITLALVIYLLVVIFQPERF